MNARAYLRPAAPDGALRLHLNENTSGCSERALDAVRSLTASELASYPKYDSAIDAVSRRFHVPSEYVLLTKGLDEGIVAATGAAFRRRDAGTPEGVGVRPAFDMYGIAVDALGGRMRQVPLDHGGRWEPGAVAACVGTATRIVFITNPHNPSGATVSTAALLDLASRVRPAMLFVDEAYADFSGATIIDARLLREHRNVVVGRTFAKAYGLAGLRIGALIAAPETLEPIRRVVPPYSVNAAAAAALPAALSDDGHTRRYIDESRESRALIMATCERLRVRTFPSSANFVLIDVGADAAPLVAALAARGIAVRHLQTATDGAGWIRVTAGTVDDTKRFVAELEDVWRERRR
jgi:histidinol-phosphate aminotransferase